MTAYGKMLEKKSLVLNCHEKIFLKIRRKHFLRPLLKSTGKNTFTKLQRNYDDNQTVFYDLGRGLEREIL